ncbi:hypothetical protein H5410_015492 [Solanum commersonii]|uniref:Uncharacterized protein n=1 Tax=Solanum commersonii TaxID=4109 RepID=A0A9J5ZUK1_SOLCO|nr:hypothetical protein H5410_015492 [Solanum commersonii]
METIMHSYYFQGVLGIFRSENVPKESIVKIVYYFHGQSIGINTREFKMKFLLLITDVYLFVEKFFGYGNMLVQEQEDVMRV